MREIRVAIAGVGNCASALIQGLSYYRDSDGEETPLGLMHTDFGGYKMSDIRPVAAFDVDKDKIGKDLAEAIFTPPNCCYRFAKVPPTGVKVSPAPVGDGVAPHMRRKFKVYDERRLGASDVVETLKKTRAEILVSYLPVGSAKSTRHYTEACLEAGCAFINCIPEFIASDPKWAGRFEKAGLPVAGDDIKSQVGATIVHRALANLLVERGVRIDETYQMNLGGNTDFLNMTVEERLTAKRRSKTEAVKSLIPYEVPTRIGPSDYVPFLGDKKVCYIHIKGRKFGDAPLRIDLKLSVEDSPNSAGVVVDVVRATKLALDRGVGGPLESISAYAFKRPPLQAPDSVARGWVEEFIQGRRPR